MFGESADLVSGFESNETSGLMVLAGLRFAALVLAVTIGLWPQPAAKATTWDQIGRYLRLIQSVGIEAMVANDCPLGLFGAYHAGREVLLMCGNNIPDDPAVVWEVLAHESAHAMQVCKGGT